MTDEELAAIEARLKKATPGPWRVVVNGQGDYDAPGIEGEGDAGSVLFDAGLLSHTDRALIAHAPADLRALIAEVERLRAEVATLRRCLPLTRPSAAPTCGSTTSTRTINSQK